jgi:hypothetical protein
MILIFTGLLKSICEMKIIDCFNFFNELDLWIGLQLLDEHAHLLSLVQFYTFKQTQTFSFEENKSALNLGCIRP